MVLAACAALLTAAGAASAQAQDDIPEEQLILLGSGLNDYGRDEWERAVSVIARSRIDYEPQGIRAGSFLFFPVAGVSVTYDSNIFATPDNAFTDTIVGTDAALVARSNWGRHALEFGGLLASREYNESNNDSFLASSGYVLGRYDIAEGVSVEQRLRLQRLYEGRGGAFIFSPGGASEPVGYTQFDSRTTLRRTVGRWEDITYLQITDLDYTDVTAVSGTILDQDNRDGGTTLAGKRLAYELSSGFRLLTEAEGVWRSYEAANSTSESVVARGGLDFELSRLTYGTLLLGYLHANYDSPGLDDLTAFSYKGQLFWNPTPLMTFSIDSERRLSNGENLGAETLLETFVTTRLDYELRRNLLLGLYYSYRYVEYQGSTQRDNEQAAGIAVDHTVHPSLRFGVNYEYTTRDSNIDTADYGRHRTMVSGSARF